MKRLLYPDLCKVIAIFLVTLGHCAQALSGTDFPQFLGGQGVLIPIHMPLFMMMSGFFIQPDRIRSTPLPVFVRQRALRLLLPSLVWYILYSLCTSQGFSLYLCSVFYWFLNCLFVCQMIIWAVVRLFRQHSVGILLSALIVLLLPKSDFLQINFMYPFLWAGYALRQFIQQRSSHISHLLALTFALTVAGYCLWDYHYSVYLTPFSSLHFSLHSLLVYGYRFLFGAAASTTIIGLVYLATRRPVGAFCQQLSTLGRNTLVIYTGSFVLNALVRRILLHSDAFLSGLWLEPLALLLTLLILLLCSLLAHLCRPNRIASLLLLGEAQHKS